MLPTLRTHPRLHRRNPQINFLIVTNHRYILKDSDLFEVYNPELDATNVNARSNFLPATRFKIQRRTLAKSNVLLRDISEILFTNNPVKVPVIK